MNLKPPPVLIRATAVARRFGSTPRTVISAAERGALGGLVPVKIGKLTFFSAAAVEAFIDSAAGATAQQVSAI